jgi:hypothetical protein
VTLNTGFHTIEIGYQNYNNDAVIGEFYIQKASEGVWRAPLLRYIGNSNAGHYGTGSANIVGIIFPFAGN